MLLYIVVSQSIMYIVPRCSKFVHYLRSKNHFVVVTRSILRFSDLLRFV